jgi:hypothetical protein
MLDQLGARARRDAKEGESRIDPADIERRLIRVEDI